MGHPSQATSFDWNEGNETELETSEHPIAPWEAEEVFWNKPSWSRNKQAGSGDWRMGGRTDGGRPLTLMRNYDEENGPLPVITGWAATKGECSKKHAKSGKYR